MAKSRRWKGNYARGGLVQMSSDIEKRTQGSRHMRRKAEKLAKKHPTEVAHVLRVMEERDVK